MAEREQEDGREWTSESWERTWWDSKSWGWEWDQRWSERTWSWREETEADDAQVPKLSPSSIISSASSTSQKLIFVLGMPKAGTTSLHEAFLRAGLSSVHWALDQGKNLSKDKQLRLWGDGSESRLVGRLIEQAVSEGKEPLAYLPQVEALAEMNGMFWKDKAKTTVQAYFPQMEHLERLLEAYPNAYFILNVRNLDDWVRSVNQHNDLRKRFVCADLPGLPPQKGAKDEELVEWVKAHQKRVLTLLPSRKANLLHFNIDLHGSDELSQFLQCPITWPHCNRTARR
ncbi:unnamed protein product [Symbiodinium microadriaticum]|nr:unnamed protein product [Symbiodinium microadriaticum]